MMKPLFAQSARTLFTPLLASSNNHNRKRQSTQKELVLDALMRHGALTVSQLRAFGVKNVAQQIYALRKQNYQIRTEISIDWVEARNLFTSLQRKKVKKLRYRLVSNKGGAV